MSEGTPGRAPDADTRTEPGSGQGPTNGRPAGQPVRYGPRNGIPRNGSPTGRGGSGGSGASGRTVPGPSSPQQYRSPQSRGPQNGNAQPAPAGAAPSATDTSTGTSTDHAEPSAYARPRPDTSADDRRVAEARTAAAARHGGHGRARGSEGSATPATEDVRPLAGDAAPETTVMAAVPAAIPADGTAAAAPDLDATRETTTVADGERGRSLFGRLRDARERLVAKGLEDPDAAAAVTSSSATTAVSTESAAEQSPAVASAPASAPQTNRPAESDAAQAEPDVAPDENDAREERTLTWRDRLGLPPKARKPEPVEVPDSGPGVPTAAAAAALAISAAAGTATPETKASPTGPTSAPEPAEPLGRVTPTSPVPAVSPDTVVIPVVDAGSVSPASPAAAATTQALVAAKPKVGAARRTRKARLRLSRVDPWSVMKTAFLFSIAAGIILVVATYGVWSVLNASGLFDAVNDMVKSVVSTPGDTTPFRVEEYVNTQKILGVAAIIAVVDVLIFTALATLGSFLYNLAATVLGGLEVTLAED